MNGFFSQRHDTCDDERIFKNNDEKLCKMMGLDMYDIDNDIMELHRYPIVKNTNVFDQYKIFPPMELKIKTEKVIHKRSTPSKSRKKKPKIIRSDVIRQTYCCIDGCEKISSNRLIGSYRIPNPIIKEGYEKMNWTCICKYHYFSALHDYKKRLDF